MLLHKYDDLDDIRGENRQTLRGENRLTTRCNLIHEESGTLYLVDAVWYNISGDGKK